MARTKVSGAWTRREALSGLLVLAGAAGCSKGRAPAPCLGPTRSSGATYCLVEPAIVRVAGGRALQLGEAALYNVDDDTAVILARDDRGFFAVSAICTHACCLVALCEGPACEAPLTNPGECQSTVIARPAPRGVAFVCACHGSEFALDGTPLSGPATVALPHYALSHDGNDALVDTAQVVGSEIRV